MDPKNKTTATSRKDKESERGKLGMVSERSFSLGQYGLRVLCWALCLAALIVMITSGQTLDFGGFKINARYNYSTAFVFLAGVDGVVCGCSLLSLLYVFLLSHSKPHPNSWLKLLVHDLAMLLLMTAGCAAGTAIGYVGRYGQSQSGWAAICFQVGKFCNKITISVTLSYIALIFYVLLTLLALLKIKSSFPGTNEPAIPVSDTMISPNLNE